MRQATHGHIPWRNPRIGWPQANLLRRYCGRRETDLPNRAADSGAGRQRCGCAGRAMLCGVTLDSVNRVLLLMVTGNLGRTVANGHAGSPPSGADKLI
jgi:hypothetical protein